MTRRLIAAAAVLSLFCAATAQAQAPDLSKRQREMLRTLVAVVDSAQSAPESPGGSWQTHLMRASDGSHYVAFTVEPTDSQSVPATAALVYVRLATASPASAQPIVERSAIREWLDGRRTDPRLLPRRALAIGDMPAFGAGGIAARGSTPSTGSTDLKLMDLERERQRQEKEERERERRAQLEGKGSGTRDLLPFEDFDLALRPTTAGERRGIRRAFTAGPGEYELFVAWADATIPKGAVATHVVRRRLHLPVAPPGLHLGSIVLAQSVTQRDAPYSPAEQAAHPYSIGAMEITPRNSADFTRDQSLTAVFQIMNAQTDTNGMPDVAVGLRIVRVADGREQQVASLSPQFYNATTLPADFNLRAGHPLFAATAAPLATLPHGAYRLKVVANDRIAGTATAADIEFSVAPTLLSLLDEAPRWGVPLDREQLLSPGIRATLADRLAPPTASAALREALDTARHGRLVDLLVEDVVPPSEQPIRLALTALALMSVGDASAVVQLQRALELGAPPQPVQTMIGLARASQGRDVEALAAWDLVRADGALGEAVAQCMLDAALRIGDIARAERIAAGHTWTTLESRRSRAALAIAAGRDTDALSTVEALPPEDEATRWLRVHALYAKIARGRGDGSDRDAFVRHAREYITAGGTHAALAGSWLALIESR